MEAWSPAAAVSLIRGTCQLPPLHCAQCMFSSHPEGERKVTQILKISRRLWGMYKIQIKSEEFKEKRTVQQTTGTKRRNQRLSEEEAGKRRKKGKKRGMALSQLRPSHKRLLSGPEGAHLYHGDERLDRKL
ncbi:hypothetical protein MJT46_012874 [Ovis ammon polii x Ovis aries]|nr:hypothetical protein MJT46_012874 [Ovis ammon polii x Ovis aries]